MHQTYRPGYRPCVRCGVLRCSNDSRVTPLCRDCRETISELERQAWIS